MNSGKEAQAVYRLGKARETLEEAIVLAKAEHWQGCTNRLYYACFYVVWALLLTHGFTSKKHSGIRSLFNRNFIKTRQLNTEMGDLYADLYETRMENDYDDLEVEPERIQLWLEQVPIFIDQVELIVRQKLDVKKLDDE